MSAKYEQRETLCRRIILDLHFLVNQEDLFARLMKIPTGELEALDTAVIRAAAMRKKRKKSGRIG